LQAGLNVKIAAMPAGEDPADLIRRDPAAWKEAVRSAVHVVDFYLAHLKKTATDARRFKLEASKVVLPYVAMIGNAIDQAHFVRRVADAIDVPEDAVRAELGKLKSSRPAPEGPGGGVSVSLERLLKALKNELGDGSAEDRAALVEADL